MSASASFQRSKNLQRDFTAKAHVFRAVDDAHAAAADFIEISIVRDDLAEHFEGAYAE